jgi:hypothetical protein
MTEQMEKYEAVFAQWGHKFTVQRLIVAILSTVCRNAVYC